MNTKDHRKHYVQAGDEDAFAALVRDHLKLVFSTALRRLNGDHTLAEDATQTVFTQLARKARSLPSNVVLAGWLYRQTCSTTSNIVRGETRRRNRERNATNSGDWSDD